MNGLEDLAGLAADLARLEMDRDSCDIVFVVGRDEARVSGHSALFSVRCPKFVDIVTNNSSSAQQQGLVIVNLSFVSSEGFIKFVHWVYTGQLELGAASPYDVMAVASLLGVESLTRWLMTEASNSLTPRTAEAQLNEAAAVSDLCEGKAALVRPLLQWVGDNIVTLRDRNLLDNLEKPALLLLVSSGHLCLHANDVWRLCLRWAGRRCGLGQARSEADRARLRAELEGLLQWVKLANIDNKVWTEEVEPSGVLTREMMVDRHRREKPGSVKSNVIERSGNIHSNTPQPSLMSQASLSRLNIRAETGTGVRESAKLFVSSRILSGLGSVASQEIGELVNSWVQRPGQAWSVIFTASQHGYKASAFHAACDGASPSLVLVRADTGHIAGGFTEVPWSSSPAGKGRYVSSDQSFLFSLHAPSGPNVCKFEIKKRLFAVSHHPSCGPIFGAGADLFISDLCHSGPESYSNLPHSYGSHNATPASLMGDYNFVVDEYEVLVPVLT